MTMDFVHPNTITLLVSEQACHGKMYSGTPGMPNTCLGGF